MGGHDTVRQVPHQSAVDAGDSGHPALGAWEALHSIPGHLFPLLTPPPLASSSSFLSLPILTKISRLSIIYQTLP